MAARIGARTILGRMTGAWSNPIYLPGNALKNATAAPPISVKIFHRFWCAVKSRAFSAGVIPARQLSFQPVAIGAAMEVTKSSEPSTEGSLWRLCEQAGRNLSERRAGLEKGDAGADPARIWGRPPLWKSLNDKAPRSRRGSGDGMLAHGNVTEHGKPQRWRCVTVNRTPARDRPGRVG